MPRKRKSSKKKFFSFVIPSFKFLGWGLFKILPVTFLLLVFYFSFLSVKGYLYADGNLLVSNIRLITDGQYSREDVLRRAEIIPGTNIFDIDLGGVASRLKKDARVRDAIVKKEFPNTVLIDLKIRKPVAALTPSSGGKSYLLDREGFIISSLSETEMTHWVNIRDGSGTRGKLKLGSQYFSGNIENAFFVIHYLNEEEIFQNGQIEYLKIDRLNNLSLFINQGPEIKLGSNRLMENLRKIPEALKILKDEKVETEAVHYMDLRFDDIIIKKK